MCTGIQNVGYEAKKYYDEYGKRLVGWQKIDSAWYYFDVSTGKMQTGWMQDGGDWYYLSKYGEMVKSKWIDGYYVNELGKMLKDCTINIDGKEYVFDSNGKGETTFEDQKRQKI